MVDKLNELELGLQRTTSADSALSGVRLISLLTPVGSPSPPRDFPVGLGRAGRLESIAHQKKRGGGGEFSASAAS
jgi:hypothetical protein